MPRLGLIELVGSLPATPHRQPAIKDDDEVFTAPPAESEEAGGDDAGGAPDQQPQPPSPRQSTRDRRMPTKTMDPMLGYETNRAHRRAAYHSLFPRRVRRHLEDLPDASISVFFAAVEAYESLNSIPCLYGLDPHTIKIPKSYKEAMKTPEVAYWQAACDAEVQSLRKNNTWIETEKAGIVNIANINRGRWVFTLKLNADREISRFQGPMGSTRLYAERRRWL
jgi:hypothetical protein